MALATALYFAAIPLHFPGWLRLTHFINLLFLGLLIRSGIQIVAAHPRLYWRDSCNPDMAWLTLTRKNVPVGELYTSMDDELPVSPWLAQPGKDNLGLGRLWHFFVLLFWLLNGLIYVALLFATGEWSRLIPTSWDIFLRAWHTLLIYLSFHLPPKKDFQPYDPLQQLAYGAVVFLLAPFMLLTGAAMSPAIEARYPWYLKLFGGRQRGRSLHFLSMLAFVGFIVIHTALVLIVRFPDNIRHIVFGTEQSSVGMAVLFAALALAFVAVIYIWASWYTLRQRRTVQHALSSVVDPIVKRLLHYERSRQDYEQADITSYFWINGRPPLDEEFERLKRGHFRAWRLHIDGEIAHPLCFSLEDLRQMPKQTQITKHNCIQGWSGVAEWGGVPLASLLDRCHLKPTAKYVVFTSYQRGQQTYPQGSPESQQRQFYEVIDLELARHPQTILAYEMNGRRLPLEHGAPLRLRVETQLGYKMVKWIRSMTFVSEYGTIGEGNGGFREDVQFYGRGAEI